MFLRLRSTLLLCLATAALGGGGHSSASSSCAPAIVNVDWKLGMNASEQKVTVRSLGVVQFTWSGHHNVAEVSNLEKYNACNMTGAVDLSPSHDHVHDHSSHAHRRLADETYNWQVGTAAGPRYIVCEVPGHCSAGQRIVVTVEACAYSSTDHDHAEDSYAHKVSLHSLAVLCAFVAMVLAQL